MPKPTPGIMLGWGVQPTGGKAKGNTVAWGELHLGPHFPSPMIWGSAIEGMAASHAPHATAKELLTRATPFPSLLGLLLCHCSVELLQSRGKLPLFFRTADLGQGLWERVQAPSRCQDITCQVTLPQCRCGAEKPVRLHLFHRTAAQFVGTGSSGTGWDVAAPSCAHTCTPALDTGLPSH